MFYCFFHTFAPIFSSNSVVLLTGAARIFLAPRYRIP